MKPEVRFPTAREKLLHEVSEYLGISPAGRVEAVFQISSLCESIRTASPHRIRQLELLDRNEELEHQTWRDLIARHERRGTVHQRSH